MSLLIYVGCDNNTSINYSHINFKRHITSTKAKNSSTQNNIKIVLQSGTVYSFLNFLYNYECGSIINLDYILILGTVS